MGQACTRLMEAAWLASLVAIPLAFNRWGGYAFSIYKAVLVYLLVGVMVAAWALRAPLLLRWRQGPGALADSFQASVKAFLAVPLVAPALALAGAQLLATLASVDPQTSLWGTPTRMMGTSTLVAFVVLFLVLVFEVRTQRQVERLLAALVLGGTLVAAYGVLGWLGWEPLLRTSYGPGRQGATIGNPVMLGGYLVLVIPFSASRFLMAWRRWAASRSRSAAAGTLGLAVALALQMLALLLTNAQGPWLGLASAATVFPVLGAWKWGRWRLLAGWGVLLVAAGALILAVRPPGSPLHGLSRWPYLERVVAKIDPAAPTLRSRWLTWQGTLQLVTSYPQIGQSDDPWRWTRPLLGYGPETLWLSFPQVHPPELQHLEPGVVPDRAHNLPLQIMATAGLLGLLTWLWLLGAFFFAALRLLQRAPEPALQATLVALIAAMAGHIVEQLFGIQEHAGVLLLWTSLALVPVLLRLRSPPGADRQPDAATPRPSSDHGAEAPLGNLPMMGRLLAGFPLAALVLLFAGYGSAELVRADLAVRRGGDLAARGDLAPAAALFERAPHPAPFRAERHAFLARIYSVASLSFGDPQQKAQLLGRATQEAEAAIASQPLYTSHRLLAARLYSYWALTLDPGGYASAVDAFAQAAGLSPRSATIQNEWAKFEADSGRYSDALRRLDRAVQIDPAWPPTYLLLATVYEAMDRPAEAAQAYQQATETTRRYLASLPSLAHPAWRTRLVLAQAYRELGLSDAALQEAQAALEAAPSEDARQRVKAFMAELR